MKQLIKNLFKNKETKVYKELDINNDTDSIIIFMENKRICVGNIYVENSVLVYDSDWEFITLTHFDIDIDTSTWMGTRFDYMLKQSKEDHYDLIVNRKYIVNISNNNLNLRADRGYIIPLTEHGINRLFECGIECLQEQIDYDAMINEYINKLEKSKSRVDYESKVLSILEDGKREGLLVNELSQKFTENEMGCISFKLKSIKRDEESK